MRLSIIIPVFNVECYVGQALASIYDTKVSTDDFEVIVVNDGSRDRTMEVVRQFADRPNLTILEQENQGPSIARMSGLSVATGDYVWFMDSDDYLVEDGVGTVWRLLAEKPEVDVLMFPLLWTYAEQTRNRLDYAYYGDELVCGKSVIKDLDLPVWANQRFVFRRSLTGNKWLFYPAVLTHEDEYFGSVLVYLSPLVRVMREPVYHYRIRPGSLVTSQLDRSPYDMVSVHEHWVPFVGQSVDSEDKDWFRTYCFNRLHFLYGQAGIQGFPSGFCRFARSKGCYVWRQWLEVHPGTKLKKKVGKLFYYLFPGLRKRLFDLLHTMKWS